MPGKAHLRIPADRHGLPNTASKLHHSLTVHSQHALSLPVPSPFPPALEVPVEAGRDAGLLTYTKYQRTEPTVKTLPSTPSHSHVITTSGQNFNQAYHQPHLPQNVTPGTERMIPQHTGLRVVLAVA